MPRLRLAQVLIFAGAVSISVGTLRAFGPDEGGVISFKGRANWALTTRPSATIRAVDPHPAGLVTVFSNFGTKRHLYEDNVAWDVAGPDSGVQQQWVAMPFTPTFDAKVIQISVAVEHNTGLPNAFVLSLNADDGGQIPGKPLHSWIVKHAPKFGTCCAVDVARNAKGIKVNKGIQYWVVAKTNSDEKATRMEWDLSPRAIERNFASNNGQGWYEYTAFTSAFAVYGKKIN